MGVSLINYEGKEIIFIDYGECQTNDQLLGTLAEVEALEDSMPSPVLMLADFGGLFETGNIFGNYEFFKRNLELQRLRNLSGKVIYGASINVHRGIKIFLFTSYLSAVDKASLRSFLTKQEALDWLVSNK